MTHTKRSLARTRNRARVRLLMNEEQRLAISERLRELRENSPETNRSIGDYVGVAERTVAAWVAGEQGMSYKHAQKVAELFGCDFDWLWRGKEPGEKTGLMDALNGVEREDRLSQLEALIAENQTKLNQILEFLEHRAAERVEADARAEQDDNPERSQGRG